MHIIRLLESDASTYFSIRIVTDMLFLSAGVHIGKVAIEMNANLHSAEAVNVLKPVKEEAIPSVGEGQGQPETRPAAVPMSIKPTWSCRCEEVNAM